MICTSTVPGPIMEAGAPAGDVASAVLVKLVACMRPNDTPVAKSRSIPEIVTTVPPVTGPLLGATALTVGGLNSTRNWSSCALFCSTLPTGEGGGRLVVMEENPPVRDGVPWALLLSR